MLRKRRQLLILALSTLVVTACGQCEIGALGNVFHLGEEAVPGAAAKVRDALAMRCLSQRVMPVDPPAGPSIRWCRCLVTAAEAAGAIDTQVYMKTANLREERDIDGNTKLRSRRKAAVDSHVESTFSSFVAYFEKAEGKSAAAKCGP